MGTAASLFAAPQHPYTRALLSAIPVPDPDAPPPAHRDGPGVVQPRTPRSSKSPTVTGPRSDMEREAHRSPILFERLERERQAADRQYNDALTALDRAFEPRPPASSRAGVRRPQPGGTAESRLEDSARRRARIRPFAEGAAARDSSGDCGRRRSMPSSDSTRRSSNTSTATPPCSSEATQAAATLVEAARREV